MPPMQRSRALSRDEIRKALCGSDSDADDDYVHHTVRDEVSVSSEQCSLGHDKDEPVKPNELVAPNSTPSDANPSKAKKAQRASTSGPNICDGVIPGTVAAEFASELVALENELSAQAKSLEEMKMLRLRNDTLVAENVRMHKDLEVESRKALLEFLEWEHAIQVVLVTVLNCLLH